MSGQVAISGPATRGPGWVDALAARVERVPLPAWSVYALATLVAVAYVASVSQREGSELRPGLLLIAVQTVYPLAAGHYLTHTSREALARFRPLLDVSDEAFRRIERDFTTLSPRAAVISAFAGVLVALAALLTSSPETFSFYRFGPTPSASLRDYGWLLVLSGIGFGPFFTRVWRQLRAIADLHSRAARVDVLCPGPAHAFATYTMRASLAVVAVSYAWIGVEPEAVLTTPVILGLACGATLIAIASFILPLWGMHRRLAADRERLLDENGRRLHATSSVLYSRVDAIDMRDADPLSRVISSLIAERDLLLKVPTWPWRPETLNTFVTVLLAPIAIFFLTRLLDRLVR